KGIDEKDYKRIFDRFRQSEFGTTKNHQGHGLGLCIVKEFVDCMQGRLEIKSEKGRGTLVKINLAPIFEYHLQEDFSSGGNILFNNEELL
ncbi:MAG: ATP-binding protein, partial [Bacteroidota bacterium]